MAEDNPLKKLAELGQSPWLDFIQRSFLKNGEMQTLIDRDGLKGMTSNPAIFEKAMGHGTDYDSGFEKLAAQGDLDAQSIYEHLAIEDIQAAADLLKPVYETTKKIDGYVSLEVSPYLALKTEDTVTEARRLWKAVARDNLMVKVPGTAEGVPAIRTLIGEGMNINVTLLFSLDAYKAVAEAYIAGLEDFQKKGGDLSKVASVASFFVSRIDAMIDKKIDERLKANDPKSEQLKAVRGKTAIANAKMAYQHYLETVKSARWQALAKEGAMPQRVLWASTGVKDKAYSDVLYVEELIGPDTVNTLPPATMDAFRDHGKLRNALAEGIEAAKTTLASVEALGLDLPGVTKALVEDGVKLFAKSADDLLGAVAEKRNKMLGEKLVTVSATLPEALDKTVTATLDDWRDKGKVRDLWGHDAKLWTGGPESQWLAWLDIVDDRLKDIKALKAFQDEVKKAGYSHALLLGMGGSSLGPEVLAETFGSAKGFPKLLVLDSTDPQQIAAFEKKVDLKKTLFIVSSKSGGTLEPNILKAYFFDKVQKAVGADKAAKQFVAITDPGSHLEKVAKQDGFAHVFYGDPKIGGRYSVLSNFGIVPAAAIGLELDAFLEAAALMVRACAAGTPPSQNPGVKLGAILGSAAVQGRNKLTIVAPPAIADFGAWLEQLLAESTGKLGKGIVPVDAEPLGDPAQYGDDRLFAYIRLGEAPSVAQDAALAALQQAGQPVARLDILSIQQLGQAFFLWEFATAVAGAVIGIDPFDQPDVEASKIETKKLTQAYSENGSLPAEKPFLVDGPLQFYADDKNAAALSAAKTAAEVLKTHFGRIGAGDYAGILAYIDRTEEHIERLETWRTVIRDATRAATVAEFGPRFLHSTGQAYKGGPNSGVFLQITADDNADLPVPGEKYTFGVVKAAQARGDFAVLGERGRRALRVHISGILPAGLALLGRAIEDAIGAVKQKDRNVA